MNLRDIRIIRDLLLLADVDAPLADMRAWPEDDLELAEEWAVAVHLRASDHPVQVPHKPAFLDACAPVSAFTRVSGTSP